MIMRKITIGRSQENDVVFEQVDTISSYHSEIVIDDSGIITYNDHSTNGSWVNGQKIHKTSCVVKEGDTIMLPGDVIIEWNQIIPDSQKKTQVFRAEDLEQLSAPAVAEPVQSYSQPQPQQQAPAYNQPQPQQYQQAPAYGQPQQSQYQQQAPAYGQPQQPQYQQQAPAYGQPQQPHYQQQVPAYGQPQQPQYQQQAPAYGQPQQQYGEYREQLPTNRGLLKMALLGPITLGIYPLIVLCKISSEINKVARNDRKNTMHFLLMLLLSPITLGIFTLIWYHNLCSRIGDELKRRNIPYNFGASDFWLWCILGALIGVGPLVFIHKFMHAMNHLNGSYNQYGE
jgi:hypothetical protein